jgi:hypothetical protein
VIRKRKAVEDIEAQLAALEAELRGQSLSPDAASEEVPIERVVQDMAAD